MYEAIGMASADEFNYAVVFRPLYGIAYVVAKFALESAALAFAALANEIASRPGGS